ncbi:serine/arginine-rich splicing factor 4-like isoform X1 [Ruditapes philippinarum]|uniref:serine/arginine-rich splicing factor 4-like isoform X1 n=2 Tax=Ruditapes philippinarum TaxID=129788 RepID=UPI00295BD9F2|nr:serine/arginine-rich splicing factor 4-like isoform X1 [Ruditapes philippinarum]
MYQSKSSIWKLALKVQLCCSFKNFQIINCDKLINLPKQARLNNLNMGDLTEFPTETELRAVFDDCANGDEWLTMDEFTSFCYRFYLSPTTKYVNSLFQDLDKDGNEKLSYEEVKVLLEKQWCPMDERKEAFKTCLAACRTKTGPIDRDELRQILSGGDDAEALTDEDIDFIFNKMDLDGNKEVTEDELVKILFGMDDGARSRAVSQYGKRRKGRSRSRSKGRKRSKSRSKERKRSGSRGRKHSRSSSRGRKHSRSGSRHRKKSKSRSRSRSGHRRKSRSRSGSGHRRRSRSRSGSGHRRKSRSRSRDRHDSNERHNEQNFFEEVKSGIEHEQQNMKNSEQATESGTQETQQDIAQQDTIEQKQDGSEQKDETSEQKEETSEQKDETIEQSNEQKSESNEQKEKEDAQVTETNEQKAEPTETNEEVQQAES